MKKIENYISKFFKTEISVRFDGKTELGGRKKGKNQRGSKNIEPPKKKEEKQFTGTPSDGLPVYLESASPVLGGTINSKPIKLCDVSPDQGNCTVWGKVF